MFIIKSYGKESYFDNITKEFMVYQNSSEFSLDNKTSLRTKNKRTLSLKS